MDSEVQVATSGSIKRDDRCVYCDELMLYRVDPQGAVQESFCGTLDCPGFLVEIPE